MCGIVGIISQTSKSLESRIIGMRDTLANRGPDGKGHWVSEQDGLALGHRRLSILDLSEKGAQPMEDMRNQRVIVHNGEVYNYLEIKKELISLGYTFDSSTDTEVILAAYDRWGENCLSRFNGMFAFAIWDRIKKTLFMARDRLGIKPFYYYSHGQTFLFASEIKSILGALRTKPRPETVLIDAYMSYGYVPGEDTLLKGVKRLLPGHYMIWKKGCVSRHKYWDLEFENTEDKGLHFYMEGLKERLANAIRLRMRSDVPLGVFLSGGIDSSAITALMAQRMDSPLKTFSVAYDFGPDFNETNYARMVSDQYNTDHYEYFMTPKNFMDFVPDYVRLMDEPVTESAAISLYYIAQKAKEHVTVILSGEGADEIFGGYDFYTYNRVMEKIRPLVELPLLGKSMGRIADCLPHGKFKKYLELCLKPLNERYKGISTHGESEKKRLYSPEFKALIAQNKNLAVDEFTQALFSKVRGKDPLSQMLYFDTKTWLVDDLLIKADRMSMAPALELRVPFLDHRVVEFAAAMPSKYKIHNTTHKYILKRMVENDLPHQIINRKKMGFPTPLKKMFETDLFVYARELLLSKDAKINEFFMNEQIKYLLESHKAKTMDNHRVIWQLIVLENWLKANT